MHRFLLSGNEALARGAYEAGVKVACAYPGTPSTEILEALAEFAEVDVQWSVNEKVAYEVAHGAAVGGVRSLFACKHVGLNVAMDPLMTSCYTGVRAGFVVVVCDDPGMHSSQNEQDTRWVSIYGKLPLLEPSGPAEAREFVKRAFEMSERFDTPVLVRLTTRISHTNEDVELGQRREAERVRFGIDAGKYVMVPGNARRRHMVVEDRLKQLGRFAEGSDLNRIEMGDEGVGFITSGVVYNYLREVYPEASFLKLGMSFPFCDKKIREFASKLGRLYVVEELDGFLEEHVRGLGVEFGAKDKSWRVGELRPEYMEAVVEGRERDVKASGGRVPRMCAGCPHWYTFAALKKVGAFVAGDIGCYTLASLPPLSALHTCLCMGAGVTYNEGLRKAAEGEQIVGVVGDSTFVHSGITGLINAAYNGAKGVIVIVDNSITAMTGGQENPATGVTIRGEMTKRLDLAKICESCGADNVDVADPRDKEGFERLLRERLGADELSVIISRCPCRLLKR